MATRHLSKLQQDREPSPKKRSLTIYLNEDNAVQKSELIDLKTKMSFEDQLFVETVQSKKASEKKYAAFFIRKRKTVFKRPLSITGRMRFPSKRPPIISCEELIIYNASNQETRKHKLSTNVGLVLNHSDLEVYRNKLNQIKNMSSSVVNIWSQGLLSGSLRNASYRILAEKVKLPQEHSGPAKSGLTKNWKPPEWLDEYVEAQLYTAPARRILIAENITFNDEDVIPVYSDIENERVVNLKISDSLSLEYGEVNRIDLDKEKHLEAILGEASKEENFIRCDCHGPGKSLVPCYENENCPCYLTNKAMQRLQTTKHRLTEFRTDKPIYCNTARGPFYELVGFACSDSCACKGRCTNNALYHAENRSVPLEMFRRNSDLGFELRSSALIPAGTPFLEFVGEICEESEMAEGDQDYAYRITYANDNKWTNFVKNHKKWTKAYQRQLERAMLKNYHCNPKNYGNVGRTACHSCIANAEVLRVYQKSLSPAHVRLVMISLEDIFPGVPITIDYGQNYVQTQLHGICQCGTFACHTGKHFNSFLSLNEQQIAECLNLMNRKQLLNYQQTLLPEPKPHKDTIEEIEEIVIIEKKERETLDETFETGSRIELKML